MKTYCKRIDITDWQAILPFVTDCVFRHWKRYDFRKLLIQHGLSSEEYTAALADHNKTSFISAIENIAKDAAQRIYERDISPLEPTKIKKRYDYTSRKMREIGWECAMQQVFDYIAVYGAMEIFDKRIVPQQASSVRGRGQIYGIKMIRRWVMKDRCAESYANRYGYHYASVMKYFVKTDIQKCFPSMRKDKFMSFFRKDCANDDLLWLWDTLLESHKSADYSGFMIGSLISQWAVQYCISFGYQYVMSLHMSGGKSGRKKVTHMLVFMDDVLLTGSNRRELLFAVHMYQKYMYHNFGMRVKCNFHIKRLSDTDGIDIMGFILYKNGKIKMRRRNFIRIRRAAMKFMHTFFIDRLQAQHIISYGGFVKYSNTTVMRSKYWITRLMKTARRVISKYDKNRKDESNGISETRPHIHSRRRQCQRISADQAQPEQNFDADSQAH